ncbi:DNA-formamidopyrimidine glycosylase family protein [Tomitella fengzijianii]|uniref:Fpg/Nei family DNA glycosylase n=1 Tax=Tomitella fengzijianii TaxID=2597660 RepID=A0A516X1X4_9ACTN|nr:DNA-formamidopyrimidine glycosylase family protein [Tomitella fengzijianii]QDQ97017.1 Fpg/Nei family DNA glycosylase [Tomitella fengzijianii]
MPELPEIEALAHFLREHAVGRTVERVDVAALSVVKTFEPPISALQGRAIRRVGRAGKYLMLDCDGLFLVLHFSRAGWLRWSDELSPRPVRPGRGPLALRVHLGAGEADDGAADGGAEATAGFDVTEAGTRKSLAAWVVADPLDVPGVARLGPDAAAVGHEELAEIIGDAGGRQVRTVLTDQQALAGVGGAYADEILHRARLSPFAPAEGLSTQQVAALHAAIGDVLGAALRECVDADAARVKSHKRAGLAVHGRAGEQCPVCGDVIRQVVFEERSFQYCPACQTGGRVLADRRLSRLLK